MPIQILPARLANQIAAGEVVERPASVVKELVENSLDAGATSIELDIDQGGHKRIAIRDNGKGIIKDELSLALSRHATSKISSLDDLESITSMGFRGEALASISSVSRLQLISRPADQSEAWQAQSEGRDMEVRITPAAHPPGTTIKVEDLFFNTPARRKFLRTEKTEFAHIDEVIRRIALSRFDVAFTLKHNGKVVRKYPQANSDSARQKRIASVCSQVFAEQSLQIQSDYQGLSLSGWLGDTSCARSQSDLQYFYVNGRMMKDKLINHAIRQSFEGLLPEGQFASYVLYLKIEPTEVDVNVHPAKHEVRFHQARLVHDFIFRALADALNQSPQRESETGTIVSHLPEAAPQHDYIKPLSREQSSSNGQIRESRYGASGVSRAASNNYQQLMTPAPQNQTQEQFQAPAHNAPPKEESRWMQIDSHTLLVKCEQAFWRLPISALFRWQVEQSLRQTPVAQPLLMPVSIPLDDALLKQAQAANDILEESGVDIAWTSKRLMLRKVPAGLRELNWSQILPAILEASCDDTPSFHQALLDAVCNDSNEYSTHQTLNLWQSFTQHFADNWKSQVQSWGTQVNLTQWLNTL